MPSSALTSDDFPEALGPMMPSAWPASSVKLMPWTTVRFDPGGTTAILSADRFAAGFGNWRTSSVPGTSLNRPLSRCQPWRAATNPFQLAIAVSAGASALPLMMELAMMMPAVACCSMTR